MGSTPITDAKFIEPTSCQLDVRVYRKSDKNYWTCQIRFNRPVMQAMGMMHVWASGLAVHENFESVVVDAIRILPTTGFSFDDYTNNLRKFFDNAPSSEYDL